MEVPGSAIRGPGMTVRLICYVFVVLPQDFNDLGSPELGWYRCCFGQHGTLLGAGNMNPVLFVMWAGFAGCHAETFVTVESDVNF